MITAEQLGKAAAELGLSDRAVIVHASLRSFGQPVAGGPDALLDTLLARGCTVLVPAFTEPQFGVAPPPALRPTRNGIDYSTDGNETASRDGPVYSVGCGLINPHLGTLPATLIRRPGAVRGEHPLNSFAAVGPRAPGLIAAQSATDVYGPIRELADQEGTILLIGVGLNRMTALHLAEQRSGRRLFVRWARNVDGDVSMVEVGSCSEGFPKLEPILRHHAQTTTVGMSLWQAYPAKQVLDAATKAIAANQNITHCSDDNCIPCRDSIAGGPVGFADPEP
jgi:aminoglycoside 3-N-acetyltransferase